MPRPIPEGRLPELLAAATRVFLEQGYRRTQIADIASALGVAKGTLYLYVASKEALFDAVLRYADGEAPLSSEAALPLQAADPEELGSEVRERLAEVAIPPALSAALARRRVRDVRSEIEKILRELYRLAYAHRTAIKLIDRCARDRPDLAKAFYGGGRFAQLDALTAYLDARIRAGRLPPVPDVSVAARFAIESIATWAVHIHWDPSPQVIDPQTAEDTVVELLVRCLAASPTPPQ